MSELQFCYIKPSCHMCPHILNSQSKQAPPLWRTGPSTQGHTQAPGSQQCASKQLGATWILSPAAPWACWAYLGPRTEQTPSTDPARPPVRCYPAQAELSLTAAAITRRHPGGDARAAAIGRRNPRLPVAAGEVMGTATLCCDGPGAHA